MEITHNMGQMADLMAKMYTKFGNDDLGHLHNMTKLPPDESECSDSQGEFENKRRKSFRSEQDRLSLHADEDGDEPDNDIDNLLNEQSVKVNDKTTTDEDTLLRDLAKTFDVEEATGNDIKQQLADIANKRWGKKLHAEKNKTYFRQI